MKKGVWVLCLLMTLVLWCGCGKEPEPAELVMCLLRCCTSCREATAVPP